MTEEIEKQVPLDYYKWLECIYKKPEPNQDEHCIRELETQNVPLCNPGARGMQTKLLDFTWCWRESKFRLLRRPRSSTQEETKKGCEEIIPGGMLATIYCITRRQKAKEHCYHARSVLEYSMCGILFANNQWPYVSDTPRNTEGACNLPCQTPRSTAKTLRLTGFDSKWCHYRIFVLVGGFSRGSPVSPSLSFRRCSFLTSIILIGSQDLAVNSCSNLFSHSLTHSLTTSFRKIYFTNTTICITWRWRVNGSTLRKLRGSSEQPGSVEGRGGKAGERDIPDKKKPPLTSGIVRHDSHLLGGEQNNRPVTASPNQTKEKSMILHEFDHTVDHIGSNSLVLFTHVEYRERGQTLDGIRPQYRGLKAYIICILELNIHLTCQKVLPIFKVRVHAEPEPDLIFLAVNKLCPTTLETPRPESHIGVFVTFHSLHHFCAFSSAQLCMCSIRSKDCSFSSTVSRFSPIPLMTSANHNSMERAMHTSNLPPEYIGKLASSSIPQSDIFTAEISFGVSER
ncbi:hypothetical protein PR048_012508 [Dryococelus australis]|uniref:Uncharacterized protein n=1 Tax=Dryococelus australis TaxID=614101 RepID=A0ABQ9HPZ7_9NEOP|nr:hypothetical protein PR048_012508 [Dryococelus australis]